MQERESFEQTCNALRDLQRELQEINAQPIQVELTSRFSAVKKAGDAYETLWIKNREELREVAERENDLYDAFISMRADTAFHEMFEAVKQRLESAQAQENWEEVARAAEDLARFAETRLTVRAVQAHFGKEKQAETVRGEPQPETKGTYNFPLNFAGLKEEDVRTIFDSVYREYAPVVMQTLAQMELKPEDRQDVSQQVWTDIFLTLKGERGKVPSFGTEAHLHSWIILVTKNKAIDFLKFSGRQKRRATSEVQSVDDTDDLYEAEGEAVVIPDILPLPLDRLEREEVLGYMREALQRVPSPYREVLQAMEDLGDEVKDSQKSGILKVVAERLQREESTVKTQLHRGRIRFALAFLDMYAREELERSLGPFNDLNFSVITALLTAEPRDSTVYSSVEERVRELKINGQLGSYGLTEEHFTESNALKSEGYIAVIRRLRDRVLKAAEALCGRCFVEIFCVYRMMDSTVMRYFFIFGNHPRIAAAELAAVLGMQDFLFEKTYAIIESQAELDCARLQERLGGVVKCGVVLKNTSRASFFDDAYQYIRGSAEDGEKFFFGISAYGISLPVYELGLSLKKRFKEDGVGSRFVVSRNAALSSVVVKTNKLLTDRGVEFVVMQTREKLMLGTTRAVQPFAEFSARDYGRPARDARSGMLPPKLARMMINLARVPSGATILDPFCGSGTILQEALLMGYTRVIGSDVSDQTIAGARYNLAWLSSIQPCISPDTARLITAPVRSLHAVLQPHSVDAIVTEPYLGPPEIGRASERGARRVISELEQLYESALTTFQRILKPRGRVVVIFPIIHEQRVSLPSRFSSFHFAPDPAFGPFYDDKARGSFVYQRLDQTVRREVFVLNRL